MNNIIVRPMTIEDVEEASKIEAMVFSMPWKADDFAEMILADYAYYFVATNSDRVVGIIGLRNLAGEGEITNVAVSPDYRRYGIGRKMLKRVLDQASQLGVKDITLEVRASNEPAISLYTSEGFVTEGVRKGFYEKPVEDALIMWRRE